jgi:L-fuconolactonase
MLVIPPEETHYPPQADGRIKVMSDHDKWLAQVQEETLEPALPIIDPHHHLWHFKHPDGEHRYLLEDLLEDTGSGHNILATIFIECSAMWRADGPEEMKVVGETEFVNGIAAMSASGTYGDTRVAAGIVGTANLNVGTRIGEVLDEHMKIGGDRFCGIRYLSSADPHPDIRNGYTNPPLGMFGEAKFREGFAELGRRNMSFEGWLFHPQIPDLTSLAKAFPDTVIILDHFGGPLGVGPYAGKQDEVLEVWRKNIAELAECENVVAKLGGINMKVNGFEWHKKPKPPTSKELCEATRPYYEYTIEKFGVDRCLFESNFPVDKISCSYNTLWNSFKVLTANYSADEKAKLYHDNSARVYRL